MVTPLVRDWRLTQGGRTCKIKKGPALVVKILLVRGLQTMAKRPGSSWVVMESGARGLDSALLYLAWWAAAAADKVVVRCATTLAYYASCGGVGEAGRKGACAGGTLPYMRRYGGHPMLRW
jgi:hypothetical protein